MINYIKINEFFGLIKSFDCFIDKLKEIKKYNIRIIYKIM